MARKPVTPRWSFGFTEDDGLDDVQLVAIARIEAAFDCLWPVSIRPPWPLMVVHDAVRELLTYTLRPERGRKIVTRRTLERLNGSHFDVSPRDAMSTRHMGVDGRWERWVPGLGEALGEPESDDIAVMVDDIDAWLRGGAQ